MDQTSSGSMTWMFEVVVVAQLLPSPSNHHQNHGDCSKLALAYLQNQTSIEQIKISYAFKDQSTKGLIQCGARDLELWSDEEATPKPTSFLQGSAPYQRDDDDSS
ncbi:hypothetical protein AVEN_243694-1 [Araneus ventricosus]|uniref:Uncharacterized protein n=1 Tax=Araneus ventricosus TaxID=182803 RepID=A0A4Y2A6H5_ARAVE|nr:hypothetical protein AVEN_243694-1 [Araneus ventricosus]